MASGKAIGEFSFKAITATYSPGPAGGVSAKSIGRGRRPDSEQSLALQRTLAAPKAGPIAGVRKRS